MGRSAYSPAGERQEADQSRTTTTEIERVIEHLKHLDELSPDYIFVVDRELVVRYVNRTASRRLRKDLREIAGKYVQLSFPPAACGAWIRHILHVFKSGSAASATDLVPFPKIELLLNTKFVPVKELSGFVSAVLLVSRDVSDLGASAVREQGGPEKSGILSEREAEVLGLIAEGLTNKEVGEALFISPRTVDAHRTRIMKKLDAHNTAELIRRSRQTGLLD